MARRSRALHDPDIRLAKVEDEIRRMKIHQYGEGSDAGPPGGGDFVHKIHVYGGGSFVDAGETVDPFHVGGTDVDDEDLWNGDAYALPETGWYYVGVDLRETTSSSRRPFRISIGGALLATVDIGVDDYAHVGGIFHMYQPGEIVVGDTTYPPATLTLGITNPNAGGGTIDVQSLVIGELL